MFTITKVEEWSVHGHPGRKIYYTIDGDERERVASTICCVSGETLAETDMEAVEYCYAHGQYGRKVNQAVGELVYLKSKEEKTLQDWARIDELNLKLEAFRAGIEDPNELELVVI